MERNLSWVPTIFLVSQRNFQHFISTHKRTNKQCPGIIYVIELVHRLVLTTKLECFQALTGSVKYSETQN